MGAQREGKPGVAHPRALGADVRIQGLRQTAVLRSAQRGALIPLDAQTGDGTHGVVAAVGIAAHRGRILRPRDAVGVRVLADQGTPTPVREAIIG
ncbi:hypothetical protein GCM10009680_82310 [Streptomyces yatensis]|uniref:Uncharacterized protein n=1 Tax=Streptomyces yatensis TaxID=155177 RepID=A0ABN2JIQ1_9ACTN